MIDFIGNLIAGISLVTMSFLGISNSNMESPKAVMQATAVPIASASPREVDLSTSHEPEQAYASEVAPDKCDAFITKAYGLGYTYEDLEDFLVQNHPECLSNLIPDKPRVDVVIKTTPTPAPIMHSNSNTSYSHIGKTTFGSDGTSYTQIGKTTFSSDGTSYNRIGNTVYGSDGSSYTQIGNTTFGSDGTSYNQIGNTTFGSDGSSCTQIGSSTFCNSGY